MTEGPHVIGDLIADHRRRLEAVFDRHGLHPFEAGLVHSWREIHHDDPAPTRDDIPAYPQTSTAPAAAEATINTNPPEDHMSLTADLHAVVDRLDALGEEAVTKLEAVAANPKTSEAFTLLHALSGFDPGPVFDGAVAILKALVPQQAPAPAPAPTDGQAAAQPAFTGPQVAGQA